MKNFLRMVRGVVGTAVTWALGWGATAAGIYAAGALIFGQPADGTFQQTLIAVAAASAVTGAVAGTAFSVLLGAIFRNRKVEDLRVGRMAIWGGLAGAGIPGGALALAAWLGGPMSMEMAGVVVGTLGFAGAITAGSTVRLAQVATGTVPQKQKALEEGEDAPASSPPAVATGPAAAPTPTPSASREIDEAALEEALKDDPEIAKLLGDLDDLK